MRYRERVVTRPTPSVGISYMSWDNKNWIQGSTFVIPNSVRSLSVTRFEGCYDELHQGPPYKTGGPFDKWTTEQTAGLVLGKSEYLSRKYGELWYKYVGGFYSTIDWRSRSPLPSSLSWNLMGKKSLFPVLPTWGDVSSYGATAWKKFRPGKSSADLGVFLGEFRDVPKMLKSTARGFKDFWFANFGRNPKGAAKKAADHWLNTQFGWLPFVSDCRRFYLTWRRLDEAVNRLIKENGKWIHRGGTVLREEPEETYLTAVQGATSFNTLGINPALGGHYFPSYPNLGNIKISSITAREIWFAASFRYFIPEFRMVQWKKDAARQLFGLNLNPALIWELIPWSWLVDWFSNVGDVIANLDNNLANNLAAKFAYVMGHKSLKIRQTVDLLTYVPTTLVYDFSFDRKHRVQANPFGFGLTWENLSLRQWSILSALGITRMH